MDSRREAHRVRVRTRRQLGHFLATRGHPRVRRTPNETRAEHAAETRNVVTGWNAAHRRRARCCSRKIMDAIAGSRPKANAAHPDICNELQVLTGWAMGCLHL